MFRSFHRYIRKKNLIPRHAGHTAILVWWQSGQLQTAQHLSPVSGNSTSSGPTTIRSITTDSKEQITSFCRQHVQSISISSFSRLAHSCINLSSCSFCLVFDNSKFRTLSFKFQNHIRFSFVIR